MRGRLTLLVAALVVPVMVLVGTMIFQAYRNERNAVATTLLGTARAVSGVAEAQVAEAVAILRTLATSNRLAAGDFAGVDQLARRALGGDGRWFVLLTPDGQQQVNTRLPAGATLPRVVLEPRMLQALEAGGPYVSDLQHSRSAGGLVLHVSLPYFQEGRLKYVLSISMSPTDLARALELDRYAPGRVVTIVDRKGIIIARSRSPEKFVGHSATADIVQVTATHAEGILESVTLENVAVLTAYSRAKCGWSAAIGTPKAQLYKSTRRLFLWGGIGSALLLITAFGMAVWIGRALIRSTDVLLSEAAALGRGEVPPNMSSGLDETDFVIGAMRDTAAQLRDVQLQLEEHARDLEGKVEERTASLREAVTQMEEFSYTVSHDLRAPLRAMHAFADALLEDYGEKLDATARHYIERIQTASRRMDNLTRDLLDYSRLARSKLELGPIDTERVVRHVIEQYGELQPVAADIHLNSPLLPVLGHESSFAQCMANLLTNAAKFVPPGEKPRITVRTEIQEDRVRIWVEDQGIGIAPEHQKALFQIFQRVPTPGRYEGTGVGLAIVRRAVEKMGGSCGVSSDGQRGSRFWIELRSSQLPVAAPPHPAIAGQAT